MINTVGLSDELFFQLIHSQNGSFENIINSVTNDVTGYHEYTKDSTTHAVLNGFGRGRKELKLTKEMDGVDENDDSIDDASVNKAITDKIINDVANVIKQQNEKLRDIINED